MPQHVHAQQGLFSSLTYIVVLFIWWRLVRIFLLMISRWDNFSLTYKFWIVGKLLRKFESHSLHDAGEVWARVLRLDVGDVNVIHVYLEHGGLVVEFLSRLIIRIEDGLGALNGELGHFIQWSSNSFIKDFMLFLFNLYFSSY